MYRLNRPEGYWTLTDVARYVGHDWHTVKKDTKTKGFPKVKIVGTRRYYNVEAIKKFYQHR